MRLNPRLLLKYFGPRERAMLAVLGIVVVASFYFSSLESSRASEIQTVERQISGTGATLQEFLEENDLEALEAQIEELNSLPPAKAFPPREEVLRFEPALFQRVSAIDADIFTFKGVDSRTSIGARDVPSLNYTMEVRGTASALIDLLALAKEFDSSLISDLNFDARGEGFSMKLSVALIVNEPEAAESAEEQ